jgi:protein-L-isoaspartate(D-aspartate) O-methyltransferase
MGDPLVNGRFRRRSGEFVVNDQELDFVRRTYARHVSFAAEPFDPRLETALAEVRREDFMGPGPWRIGGRSKPTPDADPSWLYQDVLVALIPEKSLNNGQPSFLVGLIALGCIQPGEHVVHIGCGVGYYTAIMAHLAGPAGRVTGIEYEPELAARAAANLAGYPNVEAVCGDGAAFPFAPADVILVNAGASRPLDHWLDALNDGGRLILPLTVAFTTPGGAPMTQGSIFLIERHGDDYAATFKGRTMIYPCFGAQDAESEASLKAAMSGPGHDKVTRLRRGADVPAGDCWARGPGWGLTYA